MRASLYVLVLLSIVLMATCVGHAAATYRLGPDDTITVTVLRHTEYSGTFLIPLDGTVAFPGVGEVVVTGKTLTELTELLTERLKVRLNAPEVTITLLNARASRVYVLGVVAHPGVYDMKPEWHVTEALAAAGGIICQPVDAKAYILHATGVRQDFDLLAALRTGAAANPTLLVGDVVTVETVELMPVYVLGLVKSPGMLDVRKGTTILEALTQAGGPLPSDRELFITVTRGKTQVAKFALLAPLDTIQQNAPLERGDILQIGPGETLISVFVMGAVKNNGPCQVRPDGGISEVLAQAGGLTLPVQDVRLTLVRNGHEQVITEMTAPINLQSFDIIKVDPLYAVSVTVYGNVARPGNYLVRETDTALQALALAGGATSNAALSRVAVTHRSGVMETINLAPSGPNALPVTTLKLAPGDIIVVPEITSKFAVLGYVNSPGIYPLLDNKPMLLTEAIAMAKGNDKRAGLGHVAVLRAVDGKQQLYTYNIEKFLKSGDATQNPMVQPGDILYVPETRKPDWSMILQGLSTISIVYSQVLK